MSIMDLIILPWAALIFAALIVGPWWLMYMAYKIYKVSREDI
jgi:hypothetical protein